jgi:ribosomal protein S19
MRSSWKGKFINKRLVLLSKSKQTFYTLKRMALHSNFELKNDLRKFYILDSFLKLPFFVYNGKFFNTINVDKNKVGFKFGDFSITKTHKPYVSKK